MLSNVNDKQLLEINKLNKVEAESWTAYERMKEFQTTGDNRSAKFLDLIIKCIEKRCRIFGIEDVPEIYAEKQVIIVKLPTSNEEGNADTDGKENNEERKNI
jgi:hypothetical protein